MQTVPYYGGQNVKLGKRSLVQGLSMLVTENRLPLPTHKIT